ncbi:response regulator [Sphingomonas sp. MMS24-JH45]
MAPLILIVEDQPLHAKLFRDILHAGGYRTIVAGNAAEARRLRPRPPDAILLDILLPDMDEQDGDRGDARRSCDTGDRHRRDLPRSPIASWRRMPRRGRRSLPSPSRWA